MFTFSLWNQLYTIAHFRNVYFCYAQTRMEKDNTDLRRLLNEAIGTWNNDKQMTGKVFVLIFISPSWNFTKFSHSLKYLLCHE